MAGCRTLDFTGPPVRMRGISAAGSGGSVLIPCLLVLSLASITAVGLLTLSQTGARSSSAWTKDYQARLAAFSAKELALVRLAADIDYAGEPGLALPNNSGSADIVVASTGPSERSIQVLSAYDTARYEIRVKVGFKPRHYDYALAVCGDLSLQQTSMVLGDLFVNGAITSTASAQVTGDLHLYGSRVLVTDVGGKVIQIDGQNAPTVGGEVLVNQKYLPPVGWDVDALRTLAVSQGQYYTKKNNTFYQQELTGVVFFAAGCNGTFTDVTVRGVIVLEPAGPSPILCLNQGDTDGKIIVTGGYLKIISDPAVAEDMAILGPTAYLLVEASGLLDVQGCVIFGYGELISGGSATFTGPVIVNGSLVSDSAHIYQAPPSTRNTSSPGLRFNDYVFHEKEYIEP